MDLSDFLGKFNVPPAVRGYVHALMGRSNGTAWGAPHDSQNLGAAAADLRSFFKRIPNEEGGVDTEILLLLVSTPPPIDLAGLESDPLLIEIAEVVDANLKSETIVPETAAKAILGIVRACEDGRRVLQLKVRRRLREASLLTLSQYILLAANQPFRRRMADNQSSPFFMIWVMRTGQEKSTRTLRQSKRRK